MHGAKTRASTPEAYRAYVEDVASPAVDKARRERRPAVFSDNGKSMAEGVGFEPTGGVNPQRFSS